MTAQNSSALEHNEEETSQEHMFNVENILVVTSAIFIVASLFFMIKLAKKIGKVNTKAFAFVRKQRVISLYFVMGNVFLILLFDFLLVRVPTSGLIPSLCYYPTVSETFHLLILLIHFLYLVQTTQYTVVRVIRVYYRQDLYQYRKLLVVFVILVSFIVMIPVLIFAAPQINHCSLKKPNTMSLNIVVGFGKVMEQIDFWFTLSCLTVNVLGFLFNIYQVRYDIIYGTTGGTNILEFQAEKAWTYVAALNFLPYSKLLFSVLEISPVQLGGKFKCFISDYAQGNVIKK
ncbi:hypothetical protein B9Z55_026652 [Caenorhabditis nigoni]|uniref:Uncharacterized protein n=1 Tax=Caenorhabditis nigoni TaxID=1611254 RepID=A0A2G5T475_9PELO|nr:hypothetical protein B9Z55_026652 [Caenorhabditis nigoni]